MQNLFNAMEFLTREGGHDGSWREDLMREVWEENTETESTIRKMLESIKRLHRPQERKKQYMVVSALKRNEGGKLYRTRAPLHFENKRFITMDKTFRLACQNGNIKGLKRQFDDFTKVHTELQFLFTKRGREFVRDAVINEEIILIYSFYIPCAGIKNCINNCSYNLADFVDNYTNYGLPSKPMFIIGYERCYQHTVASRSRKWLDSAEIPIIQLLDRMKTQSWLSSAISGSARELIKSPCGQVLNVPYAFPYLCQ